MIGKEYDGERRRAFFEWIIPDDEIPDGSTIKWVHLVITNIQGPSGYMGNQELNALFYKIDSDLSQANAQDLWNTTDYFNNHRENYIGYGVSDNWVIDQWFDGLSDFAKAIHDALPNDFFTLGILSNDENSHIYTYDINNCYVKLEIKFVRPPVNVTVNQVLSDNSTIVGKVNRWNGNSFSDIGDLPANLTFYVGTNEILQGDQGLYSNNPKQKYNNWNELSDVTNHHIFKITNTTNQFISHLNKVYETITVKSQLNCGSTNGQRIYFKDPWYIDYPDPNYGNVKRNRGQAAIFYQRTSPFNPDYDTSFLTEDDEYQKYQGVFLEQGWPGWNPPYYSVKAEEQQNFTAHGQSITGYFLNWDGTDVSFRTPNLDTTAVVFHADGAEARALYKGHLASSVARATGYNNGRRMAKTSDGTLHLVYEDDNTIWYTYSTNGGQSWAKELAISPRPYTTNSIHHWFVHPSVSAGGNTVYVTWEEVIQSSSATNHLIDFRKKENGVWHPIENISDGSWNVDWWNGPWSEYPSVSSNDVNDVFVSWKDKTNNKIKARYYYNNSTWSYISTIYGSGYPATTVMPSGENYPLKIVWAENGKLKYISGTYNTSSNRCYWSSIQTLSNLAPSMYENHDQPSVTSDRYGYGYVSWVAEDEILYEQQVLYQKYNFGYQASSASSVYSLDFSEDFNIASPSISYDQGNHRVTVFYQYHNDIYRKYLSGSSWYFHNYNAGKYPSISSNAATGAVWTKYTSAPYLLQTENLQNHLAKVTSSELTAYKRFYFPTQTDSCYLITDLTSFECNGRALHFYDGLNSDTLQADQPLTFTYHLEFNRAQAGKWLRFWFVSGDEKYLLDQVELTGEEKENMLDRSVNFDAGKAKEGYVQIDFPQTQPFVINVVPEDNSGSGLAKVAVAPTANPFVPKTFRLNQNFPNPFNPTTQIVFDLPQDAKIRLEVFDINGHKIATLAKGVKEAGRYHVVFDAHHLASGVYIYRLTTDKGFVQSKKMMLIR